MGAELDVKGVTFEKIVGYRSDGTAVEFSVDAFGQLKTAPSAEQHEMLGLLRDIKQTLQIIASSV